MNASRQYIYIYILLQVVTSKQPPPLKRFTALRKYLRQLLSRVCMNAKAVEEGEKRNDPF